MEGGGGEASVFRSGRSTSLSTSSTFPRPVVSTQADYSTASIEEARNELMQLTNCFFLTCLLPVGRNWKSCPAKEEECNLDYADWSTQTHKRAVLLLPIPSFLFPVTLPRHHSNTLFSISEEKGGGT